MAGRHCKCLICKDDVVRGYSGTYGHIKSAHPGVYLKIGTTHEYTDLPTTAGRTTRPTTQDGKLPILSAQSGYVEMLVKVRVPINVGAAQIIND